MGREGKVVDPGDRAVCSRSNAEIAVSNPAEDMDIRLLCLLCFM
jgi:hypothetical protein